MSGATGPRVTVLMPVYNGEKHLSEAIDSILAQSFPDFEFLIIDDGSTDQSAEIASSYRDPRIRLLPNGENRGLIFTLNRGLELARGEYLARMDCDDISLPERLARQVAFLDAHPGVGICGAWFRKFGAGKEKVVRWEADPDGVRCGLLFDSMVAHPTVLLRLGVLREHRLSYDPEYKNAEDFELWYRASRHCDLANLGEVLLRYRVHPGQITQSASAGQRETAGRVRLAQLRALGIEPTPREFEIHQAISTCVCAGIEDLYPRAEQWLCRLIEENRRAQIYPDAPFCRVLVERWLTFCKKGGEQGAWSGKVLYFPRLLKAASLDHKFVVRYLLQQLKNNR